MTVHEFRRIITNELDNYPEMEPFLEDPASPINQSRKASPMEWKEGMRKDKIYPDATFINLTARWLKRDIIILPWNKKDQPLDPFVELPTTSVDSDGKYYLLYYPEAWFAQGSHYMSIMPVIPSDLSSQPR